jgi:uncharacterized membrane protein YfcA
MPLIAVILFLCSLLAFALSAVCGGGASFILIPLLGLIFPAAQIPAALSIGTAASSISRVAVLWSGVQWNIVRWFIPPAVVAVVIGAWLLTYANPLYLEFFLGLYLILNLPFIFKSTPKETQLKKRSRFKVSLIGFLTGFVSGLTGAVGLIFNRFYLNYGLSKEQIIATRAANELILHLIKIGLYGAFGLLVPKTLVYGLLISLAAILSSFALKYLLPLIKEKIFRKIGYSAMVLSGVLLFSGAVTKIISSNNVDLNYSPISGGVETRLQWKQSNFSLEFKYEEGFELEQIVELGTLPDAKRQQVEAFILDADRFVIEEVYAFRKHYYEVYKWKNGQLIKVDIK